MIAELQIALYTCKADTNNACLLGASPSFSKGWSHSPSSGLLRRGIEEDKARLWSYSPPTQTRPPSVQGVNESMPSQLFVKQVFVCTCMCVCVCVSAVLYCLCGLGVLPCDKSKGSSRTNSRYPQEKANLYSFSLYSKLVAMKFFCYCLIDLCPSLIQIPETVDQRVYAESRLLVWAITGERERERGRCDWYRVVIML